MALNFQTLKTRTLTALLFVAIMLVGLLWNHWSFLVLFSVIHFGCWIEYHKLVGLIDKDYTLISPFHKYGVMIAGWCFMLYFTSEAYDIGSLSVHSIGWWLGLIFLFVLPIVELLFSREILPKNIGYSLLGLLYISVSWGFMMDLRNMDIHSPGAGGMDTIRTGFIPVLVILSIWANDTLAYLVGSLIGKTPFSKISPKKTWEGTLGGVILCIALVTYFFHSFLPWQHLLAISTIAAITGTMGDLLESKLKRMAGVKDSGHIMPGHGGFLDRFDSLLIATPFVWLYVRLFLH
jgi:phosphatidate cytidylyltransferase